MTEEFRAEAVAAVLLARATAGAPLRAGDAVQESDLVAVVEA